jgi:hypothetical protein
MAPEPNGRAPEPPQDDYDIDPLALTPEYWRDCYLIRWRAGDDWGLHDDEGIADALEAVPPASWPAIRAGIVLARAAFAGKTITRRSDPVAYALVRYARHREAILQQKKAKRDAAPKTERAMSNAALRAMTPEQRRQHRKEYARAWNAEKYEANRDTILAARRTERHANREADNAARRAKRAARKAKTETTKTDASKPKNENGMISSTTNVS